MIIQGSYDPALVGLSLLAIIIAAYVFIDLLELYFDAQERADRIKWRIFSAVSLGLGIWIMHFLGMFAYQLPMTVYYDGLNTLASLLLAIIACLVGVKYIKKSAKHTLVYGGLFMGGGIAGMHYLGMRAMQMPAGHAYDPLLVAISILVAMVVCGAGLLVIRRLSRDQLNSSILKKLMVATVFGLAISAMHYIGMAALTHVEDHVHMQANDYQDYLFTIDSGFLMAELAVGGMVMLLFNFYTAASEKSLLNRMNNERKRLKDSENRLSTLLENIADAVAVINQRGRIELFNKSAEQMFGYDRAEVLGKNISMLMAGGDQQRHDHYMQHYMKTGHSKIIDVGTRQLVAVNKQGEEILIGLSVNKVETDQGLQFIGVMRDMTEHRRELDQLTERADYDSLTGLVNRHKLFAQIEHSIALARRNSTKVCFMFIDLDGFKEVNDNYGHHAGDELLRQVAVKLREQVRGSDVISRFGGDEFCILFDAVKNDESIKKITGNILMSFQSPFQIMENAVVVTASIGVAFYPDDAEDDGELMKHADSAMYAAKKSGKNQYMFYSDMKDL